MLHAVMLFLATASLAAAEGPAAPSVDNAWIRLVPGKTNAAAYVTLTTTHDDRLTGANSECCDEVELHEMKMEGDVMRMREVDDVPLPAGMPVTLAPLGYHIMLMGIKNPPAHGDTISIALEFASGEQLVPFKVQLVGAPTGHEGHH